MGYPRDASAVPSLDNVLRAARPEVSEGYQTMPSDWTEAGFGCLGFEVNAPQYFNYEYQATDTSFVAIARGAPDHDRKVVTYTLSGHVENGSVVIDRDVVEKP